MTNRYCARCATDVEDVGGFCLLGHPLNESAPTGSLSDLRAEVDRAFEDARAQVSVMLQGAPPPPPAPFPTSVMAAPAQMPPQTPAAYARIDHDPAPQGPGDPINDFAPAPRMDWGPEKPSRLKRRGSL